MRLLWGIASNKEEEVRDRLSAARALLDEPSPDLDDLIARVEELEAELEAESRAAEEQTPPPPVEPS